MTEKETRKTIEKNVTLFLNQLPVSLREKCLLTGGSAAFLYGSDRPFSNDIDFMVPKEKRGLFEKALGIRFEYRKSKSVFHSLASSAEIQGIPFDLIAESVIEPEKGKVFSFRITPELFRRRRTFKLGRTQVACKPPEALAASKLLAGRGKELDKYDLTDVAAIIKKTKDFDWDFFGETLKTFCRPLKDSLPILRKHAEKLGHEIDREVAKLILKKLSSLR